jgi:hypothetical protein
MLKTVGKQYDVVLEYDVAPDSSPHGEYMLSGVVPHDPYNLQLILSYESIFTQPKAVA